jgi:hypothetical protein
MSGRATYPSKNIYFFYFFYFFSNLHIIMNLQIFPCSNLLRWKVLLGILVHLWRLLRLRLSLVRFDFAKDMGIAVVSSASTGAITTFLVTKLWKCIKPKRNTSSETVKEMVMP